MKASAITRIIIFSIIIFILLGILLAGLGIGMFMIISDTESLQYNTAENEVGLPAAEINKIEIEWAAGEITIQTADTDAITFSESGVVSNEDQKMIWNVSNGTLSICYEEPRLYFGITSINSKDLIITVPQNWNCDMLNIEVASAGMQIEGLTASHVEIDTASGACDFVECNIEKLDVDTASGSITYSGRLNSLDCDAASGSFKGVFTNTPDRIQMDSASGDLDLTFPKGCGFKVTMDALSGSFISDLDVHYDGNAYLYGDLRCIIEFDGASGNIRIREK